MQTVVLAAGRGTRMGPLTTTRPKPMLPVAGVPLVRHTINAAIATGASRIVLVVGYEADVIEDYVETAVFDAPITLVEQPAQRGTADAVRCAAAELSSDLFAVLN